MTIAEGVLEMATEIPIKPKVFGGLLIFLKSILLILIDTIWVFSTF